MNVGGSEIERERARSISRTSLKRKLRAERKDRRNTKIASLRKSTMKSGKR